MHRASNPRLTCCRSVQFRPSEGVCTCNDWEINGACCHLLAAQRHPEFEGQELAPLSCLLANDLVVVGGGTRFEQPASEPLGDNVVEEMQRIQRAGEAAAEALGQQRTNADPTTAEVRSLCNAVQRSLISMPDGEAKEACLELLRQTAAEVRERAATAGFQPTAARAGKQQTKRLSRPENRRLEVPLYPGRARGRSAAAGRLGLSLPSLPVLKKRGKVSNKVRHRLAGSWL